MSITGIISGGLKLVEIIDKYVDSPHRRERAKRELFDHFKAMKDEAVNETDRDEMDRLLLAIIESMRNA